MKVGLIGARNIGTELVEQVRRRGIDIGHVVTTSGVYDISKLQKYSSPLSAYLHENPQYRIANLHDYRAPFKETDAAFLAISTLDNGETAYRYIDELFEEGKPVITCEKGALSMYFVNLLSSLEEGRLGYRATVGGGTSMLKYMQEKVRPDFDGKIYTVVNGTLNFIFDGVASGRSLGEMTYEARMLRYAEPGAETPLDVVNAEACGDIPRKSTILFNLFVHALGEKSFITNDIVKVTTKRITAEMLRELVREAGNRRYIVSIRKADSNTEDFIGGYSLEVGGWRLEGGFRQISNDPLYQRLLPRGVDNAILITEGMDESGGVYNLKGPGAGPTPTAKAMLRDLEDMRKTGIIK